MVTQVLFTDKATAPNHSKSIQSMIATTPIRMSTIRKSKTQRGVFGDAGAPHLGPGCYNPKPAGEKPLGGRRKPKLRLKKCVNAAAISVPERSRSLLLLLLLHPLTSIRPSPTLAGETWRS